MQYLGKAEFPRQHSKMLEQPGLKFEQQEEKKAKQDVQMLKKHEESPNKKLKGQNRNL